MANIVRGQHDKLVKKVQEILREYESTSPGAVASLYRQNSASIRIRIVDERFSTLSKGQRHDQVWKFISDRLSDDDVQEVSVLLLITPGEQHRSFMNTEFDDPVSSKL